MKPYVKTITMIPVLMLLCASIAYGQAEVKKHKKETETPLLVPSIQNAKDLPKLSDFDKKEIDSLRKGEGGNESSKPKPKPKPKPAQTFTGSGPAMARDNPDA